MEQGSPALLLHSVSLTARTSPTRPGRSVVPKRSTWASPPEIGRRWIRVGRTIRGTGRLGSDDLDGNLAGVSGKRFDVDSVASENRAAWLGQRHYQGVDGGTSAGASSQLGGAAGENVAHDRLEDAGLKEPVGIGVPAGVTLKRLHEHDGGDERWPQLGCDEPFDKCE